MFNVIPKVYVRGILKSEANKMSEMSYEGVVLDCFENICIMYCLGFCGIGPEKSIMKYV